MIKVLWLLTRARNTAVVSKERRVDSDLLLLLFVLLLYGTDLKLQQYSSMSIHEPTGSESLDGNNRFGHTIVLLSSL